MRVHKVADRLERLEAPRSPAPGFEPWLINFVTEELEVEEGAVGPAIGRASWCMVHDDGAPGGPGLPPHAWHCVLWWVRLTC